MNLQQSGTDISQNQDISSENTESSRNLENYGNGKAECFHVADKLKNGMGTGLLVLGGVGAGMLLMYMLDPQQGKRRRVLVRDKAVKVSNKTANKIGKKSRDLRNRAQGVLAVAKKTFTSGNNKEQSAIEENTQEGNERESKQNQEQSAQA